MSQEQLPTTPATQYIEDDEITLKQLIEKIQEFWREAWKNNGGLFLYRV
ncbi:MAG: hypothetical protein HC912_10515 [Saprospiraceae bacterium]|nr:hypothetical protein [Saprospiraceae bacterium]